MSALILNTEQTMSSREIAELTGSTHDNVLKTVRALVEKGVVFGNETPYTHPQNKQTYSEFRLDYRNTMVVVSGYSVELRARIIDRWQELEAKANTPAFNIPTTLSGALRLAAEQAEQIERQAAQIEAQKPAVEFVDRYTHADGNKGFREVAKLLNANEREFRDFLIAHEIMYRLNGRLAAHAHHQHAGRFAVKTGVSDNEHAFVQAMFTPKGIEWVAGKWAAFQLQCSEAA